MIGFRNEAADKSTFICRFTMLCIILEERRKMRKKILDAAVLTTFLVSISVTSKIQERAFYTEQEALLKQEENPVSGTAAVQWEELNLYAGVTQVLSANSFTTESDEETGIEQKEIILVASSGNETDELEDESSEQVESDTNEFGQVQETQGVLEEPAYTNRWNISLTDEEIDLLAKIVWLEANAEPVEGQEAVVEVVFNRMASDLYPDTLYDVLSQNNPVQFSSWKRRDKAQPTETEYQSIYNVLNGNTDLLRNDTMNFSTYPLTSNLDVKICCHYFCY